MLLRTIGFAIAALLASNGVQASYSPNSPNVMYYWGQNSAGGSNTQGTLASYCETGKVDVLLLSFLHIFNVGGLPGVNLANACETYFDGTNLVNCPNIGKEIKSCQSKGVKIILSLGGAAGSYGFSSDGDGQKFAQTIWDLFGGGSSSTRPFGDAQIDGVDLDIEGGSSTGYAAFVTAIRSKFASDFIVGAAPQCPFPDAILGSVIDAVGFDYVNVQFYNNFCSAVGNSFNFNAWANWAKSTSPNKNVKVYFTIPGSTSAAGSGYAPMSTIQNIVPQLVSQYSGTYGGVSVWDASQAFTNGDFASQLYSLVKGASSGGGPSPTATTGNPPSSSSSSSSSSPASSSISAVIPTGSSSATLTTSKAIATETSGSCARAGQACSTDGKYVCTSNGAYAICNHSKWSVQSCPQGTSCLATLDGASIYCGYSTTGSTACSNTNVRELLKMTLDTSHAAAVPKAYTASQVSAQLTVASASSQDFEFVLNARRIVDSPFKQQVTIEFTAPKNIKFTEVNDGTIRQVGSNVRIQAQNTYNESMTIVKSIKGTIHSGVFVAPNPASMRFK
ncbi:chitinase 2 [Cokeromyces recurvatus]|uniref:chitinase 2 n=1 Tax=Cokeromyces recurvatus TaxID=90255 RepID=UPI0022204642|nr:chitinase 2 [Cokeromyces recurvatus]KAI7905095.1 chitinase 2 [Cokeromyces recurvatus]